jgi:hypothetical protein
MLTRVTVSEIRERIARVVGHEKAVSLTQETLDRIGRNILETPEDLLLFAECLEMEDGLVKFIGRSLKTQALLRGAHEPGEHHEGNPR